MEAQINLPITIIQPKHIYIINLVVGKCYCLWYWYIELYREHQLHLSLAVEFPHQDDPVPHSNQELNYILDTCITDHAGDFTACPPAILQLVPQTDPGFVLNHNIINPCDTYIMWVLVPEYQISQPSPVAQGITVVIVPCYPQDTADLATYNMALLWADQLQAVALHPRFWCSQTLGII